MKVLLIQAIYVTGFSAISIHASDVELARSSAPVHREESGVMTRGTILDIKNNQIVVLSSGSREPIRFSHGEGTIYVDESGKPITPKAVRSGVAVTVFYFQTEDKRMANRVIVFINRHR